MYFLFSGVLNNLRLPWKTEFALKFFKPGGESAPRRPASYPYVSNLSVIGITLKAEVKVSRKGPERRSGKRIVAGTAFRLEFQVH